MPGSTLAQALDEAQRSAAVHKRYVRELAPRRVRDGEALQQELWALLPHALAVGKARAPAAGPNLLY